MAGGAAGVIFGACLGRGTIRRGAGVVGGAATGALAWIVGRAVLAGGGAAITVGFGATTAAGRGGWLRASASACFRARIAFIASPGFEM
jgi:hypothetical protein